MKKNKIKYIQSTKEDIDQLVAIRIRDLEMYSNEKIKSETINNIRKFFEKKLKQNECITILGYDEESIIATGSIYYYDIMPSNENPTGRVGQITNIWVDKAYRGNGIAKTIIQQLLQLSEQKVGMVCLNATTNAKGMYESLGFKYKDNYMVYS